MSPLARPVAGTGCGRMGAPAHSRTRAGEIVSPWGANVDVSGAVAATAAAMQRVPARVVGRVGPKVATGSVANSDGSPSMLYYAVVFLIIAIIAGILGFWGLAATAGMIAKVIFVIFLILALISFLRRA